MRDKHIIGLLEDVPLAELSEGELAVIREHTGECEECRRAFDAAAVSAELLRVRVADVVEPSPFFQTRVMAALREQRTESELPVFARLWKTAGALVTSMAAAVVLLAALTFLTPDTQKNPGSPDVASTFNSYSAEEVILPQDQTSDDQMSIDQVFATLYDTDEGTTK
jgi:hypothetical protein